MVGQARKDEAFISGSEGGALKGITGIQDSDSGKGLSIWFKDIYAMGYSPFLAMASIFLRNR